MKNKDDQLSCRFLLMGDEWLFFEGLYLLFEVVVLFFELNILSDGIFDYFVPLMFAVGETLFERSYLLLHGGVLAEYVFQFFNRNRSLSGVALVTHLYYSDDGNRKMIKLIRG